MIGNQTVVRRISAMSNGDASLVFLVTGPEGIGKIHLARQIASTRLGRPLRSVESEVIQVQPDSGSISIKQVHELLQQCKRSAVEPRTVIITDAQRLSTEAANALLVFLERPPQKTVVILTAVTSLSVIPTVRSRCIPFVLGPVAPQELRDGLLKASSAADPAIIEEAVRSCGGSPGIALKFIADAEFRVQARAMHRLADQWHSSSTLERMQIVTRISEQPQQARELLGLIAKNGPIAQRPAVLLALQRLQKNVQPRAVLEAFAMLPT